MQISIKREELLKPLSIVAGVVERRQTLPILSYALFRHDGNGTTLSGTDLEVEVITKLSVVNSDEGALTLPARKLLDICRALPEDTKINIKHTGDKAVLNAGKSRFTLLTLPPNDFPDIETNQWEQTFSMTQSELQPLLEKTHFCMAQQDVRYYLNGMLLESGKGVLRAVATDGHRMAISETTLKNADIGDKQVIIPRKGVQEIIRLLGTSDDTVGIQTSSNHIRTKTSEITFTSKLIDGRFPEYNKVIPSNQTKMLQLEREPFREALSRVAILSNEKYRGVRLRLSKRSITINAHNPEQEEAEEELSIQYEGEELEIGFNVNYLIEATSALTSHEMTLGLNDANSSCTISSPDDTGTQYVIMPMRL
jgi:DNA polymerase III subunit beta